MAIINFSASANNESSNSRPKPTLNNSTPYSRNSSNGNIASNNQINTEDIDNLINSKKLLLDQLTTFLDEKKLLLKQLDNCIDDKRLILDQLNNSIADKKLILEQFDELIDKNNSQKKEIHRSVLPK